jgi:alpha-acetolactate decarboxylase
MRLFWLPGIVMSLTIGCTDSTIPDAPGWDGKVQQWGTLRAVMHGEIRDGQISLSDVTGKPHVYGIGAPDGLRGEILIADSVAWVAKVRDGDQIETRQSDSHKDSAVFLAVAQVPQWTTVRLERDTSAEEFDNFVQTTISDAGLDKLETVPFVIDGNFPTVELHVLNGQCPFANT